MTCDEAVAVLRGADFTVTALHQTVVTGERPIPGHPGWYRAVALTGYDSSWHGAMYLKRPQARNLLAWEYTRELGQRGEMASPEQLGLWVGGVCSVPVDADEARAIMRGRA
jgi:hypothetical protein